MPGIHMPWRFIGAVLAVLITALLSQIHRSSMQSNDGPTNRFTNHHSSPKLETPSIPPHSQIIGPRNIPRPFGRQHHTVNFTSRSIKKRVDVVISYDYAVCKGKLLWNAIQDANNGQRPPTQQFTHSDYKEAWSLDPGLGLRDRWWDDFFRSVNGRVPVGNEYKFMESTQNKQPFRNSFGQQISVTINADYDLVYIPNWSAMLAMYVYSPSARLMSEDDSPYGRVIPKAEIPPLIPRLHRLSDVSWYVYSNYTANPGGLRYIGHNHVENADTASIMDYLFIVRYGNAEVVLPWPGMVFDIGTDAAKALLATPNGVSIAYIMIDHAVMGRRRPRVHLMQDGEGVRRILWDLIPGN
ncbi:MAG: hypothetical protein Q9169_004169 [Polycauliona sp. 2 TL-2023]